MTPKVSVLVPLPLTWDTIKFYSELGVYTDQGLHAVSKRLRQERTKEDQGEAAKRTPQICQFRGPSGLHLFSFLFNHRTFGPDKDVPARNSASLPEMPRGPTPSVNLISFQANDPGSDNGEANQKLVTMRMSDFSQHRFTWVSVDTSGVDSSICSYSSS